MKNGKAQVRRLSHYGTQPEATSTICVAPRCEASPAEGAPVPLCSPHIMRVAAFYDWTPSSHIREVERKRTHGSVYFIRRGEQVKIGWSRNVPERFQNVGGDALLHTEAGTRADERRLHAAFAHRRIEGEWFEAAPDLMSFILRLKTGAA